MSLIRTSSRKQFSITPEDIASCLDQKNSMIAVLQAEVEDLRFNHEKYQRMQQEVCKGREKYETCFRNYQISKVSNQQRLDLTVKNSLQLKIQVEHLNKQIQFKAQQLRDAKAECQYLMEHSGRREDEVTECAVKGEQLRNTNDLLKIQEERIRSQITLSREELQRQRRENVNISKSHQTVKDKCYKTQAYIRNLLREQSTLNQGLAKIEDENNYLDNHVSELNTVQGLTDGQVAQMEKDNQQQKFLIASKELELKRFQKETKQAAKTLAAQRQKARFLVEQVEQKKNSSNRLQSEIRECSDEINFIMARNNQVTDVNAQLKGDLKVCERHLDNVIRVNKSIDTELVKFKEINIQAIKKLQEPMTDSFNTFAVKATPRKWSETSRMTGTGGFDINMLS